MGHPGPQRGPGEARRPGGETPTGRKPAPEAPAPERGEGGGTRRRRRNGDAERHGPSYPPIDSPPLRRRDDAGVVLTVVAQPRSPRRCRNPECDMARLRERGCPFLQDASAATATSPCGSNTFLRGCELPIPHATSATGVVSACGSLPASGRRIAGARAPYPCGNASNCCNARLRGREHPFPAKQVSGRSNAACGRLPASKTFRAGARAPAQRTAAGKPREREAGAQAEGERHVG